MGATYEETLYGNNMEQHRKHTEEYGNNLRRDSATHVETKLYYVMVSQKKFK